MKLLDAQRYIVWTLNMRVVLLSYQLFNYLSWAACFQIYAYHDYYENFMCFKNKKKNSYW